MEWIKCSERMPEYEELCLLFDPSFDGIISTGWLENFDEGWFRTPGGITLRVTHWMPLPQPPK